MSTNQEQIETEAADPLNEWFRRIGTTLTNDDYEAGIQAMAAHDAAVIAAIHPTVTTVEELDALPEWTIIQLPGSLVLESEGGAWYAPGDPDPVRVSGVFLPATVLHIPGGAA